MKKLFFLLLIYLLLTSALSNSASAESLNWYCIRERDHKTPNMPREFSFISECGSYSSDRRYTDYNGVEKVIYLTFDAGYENGNIEKIMNVLKEENVTAAFFILGNLIVKNPQLVSRMAEEGHLVCNHTYSHANMSLLDEESFSEELRRLEDFYREQTGKELAKYYRPPEGCFSKSNLVAAEKLGYKTVFWSFAYADWDSEKQPSHEYALKKIKDNLHNGEIMLLHPTSSTNAEIMRDVIKYIKGEGFRFASLDELA